MTKEIVLSQQAEISADWETIDKNIDELLIPYSDLTEEVVAQIDYKQLKRTRAELNRIDKELNDGRKAIKAAYNEPLKEFEAQCKLRSERIQEPNRLIKEAIARKESEIKKEKFDELYNFFCEYAPLLAEMTSFDMLIDNKWLNLSFDIEKAKGELEEKINKVATDWDALKESNLFNKKQTEIEFFKTLDLAKALAYDKRNKEDSERLEELHYYAGDVETQPEKETQETVEESEQDAPETVKEECVDRKHYALLATLSEKELSNLLTLCPSKSGAVAFEIKDEDFEDAKDVFSTIGVNHD